MTDTNMDPVLSLNDLKFERFLSTLFIEYCHGILIFRDTTLLHLSSETEFSGSDRADFLEATFKTVF